MAALGEGLHRRRTHTPGRTVGIRQQRVGRLQILQFLLQSVVLRVRDQGRIQHVVAAPVLQHLGRQFLQTRLDVHHFTFVR